MHNEPNHLAQPLGAPIPHWQPATIPTPVTLSGNFCRLEPLTPQHAADLYLALGTAHNDAAWTYLPYGPFATRTEFTDWIGLICNQADPLFFALVNLQNQKAQGLASYLRIDPAAGSIEVGHLNFSPAIARTPVATEAMYLMMRQAFTWGYRRYEWKCNSLNTPSRRAAERLGLTFEGVFRQAAVIKGHNRDTAWFAAIDIEWPALNEAFLTWLAADNFTPEGHQRSRLSALSLAALAVQCGGTTA